MPSLPQGRAHLISITIKIKNMCLILDFHSKGPSTAGRDILVFKIVYVKGRTDNTVKSGDKNYTYERGKHYYQDKDFSPVLIDTGGSEDEDEDTGRNTYIIKEGLHAFTSQKKAETLLKLYGESKGMKAIVVKMIIPAGAQYYKNKHGEIVSNEIIYPPKQWRITAQTL